MTQAPYTLEDDARPRLGLIVLQADETIEDEFRRYFRPNEIRLHVARIPSGTALTSASIQAMETALPAAAGLFPEGATFDAVAYACTSGTSLIGAERVQFLVQTTCRTEAVTNPLTATFAALNALNASRVGIVSPYTPDIVANMRADFEKVGFAVPQTLSFGEEIEANVARIAPASIVDAARALIKDGDPDAVFLSCTNLRTFGIIDRLEADLGVPVLSSNQTLAWHMAKLAGLEAPSESIGRLNKR